MSISLDGNIDESIGLITSDSTSIQVSTLLLDDIPTSASGKMLVGTIQNPTSGKTEANAYFRMSTAGLKRSIPENAKFDSVTIQLYPNKYYYGDTTKNINISVHRVNEELKLQTNSSNSNIIETPVFLTQPSIFNKQKYAFDNIALGSKTFKPEINSLDSINIKLDNAFGKELYDGIVNSSLPLSSEDNFVDYIKGLVLRTNDNNQTIIGLKDSVQVRLHYSYPNGDGFNAEGYEEFTTNRNYSYNNINADRTNTLFANLTYTNPIISTQETDGVTIIGGGVGIVTKIKFPYLKEYMSHNDIAINKAQLVIEVPGVEDKKYPLPTSLNIFIANSKNIPESLLQTSFSAGVQSAILERGNHSTNGKYVFDLTQYIKNLNNNAQLSDKSLLISLPTDDLLNSVNKLEILSKDNKPQIKLNIVYTKFKN